MFEPDGGEIGGGREGRSFRKAAQTFFARHRAPARDVRADEADARRARAVAVRIQDDGRGGGVAADVPLVLRLRQEVRRR